MARDKLRRLEWGSANRPKVSNKLGIPNSVEGGDGDIQVRQTSKGARLFAKLGGRWFSNLLHDAIIDHPHVSVAKMYTFDVIVPTAAATTATIIHTLPEFITNENILGATIMFPTYGGLSLDLFMVSEDGAASIDIQVSRVHGSNDIYIDNAGSAYVNRNMRMTVFFK